MVPSAGPCTLSDSWRVSEILPGCESELDRRRAKVSPLTQTKAEVRGLYEDREDALVVSYGITVTSLWCDKRKDSALSAPLSRSGEWTGGRPGVRGGALGDEISPPLDASRPAKIRAPGNTAFPPRR
ncbi:unnamed protein product [Arctogadus glacialis]